jgi:hypothetical protein
MKTSLYSQGNRNATVKTRWGPIAFDKDGFAEIDATTDDLPLLKALGWLIETTVETTETTAPGEDATAKAAEMRDRKQTRREMPTHHEKSKKR